MTRIVGKRRPRPITREPSGELLREGALFNDELHRLPTGATTWFPKGVYRYRTHEEANAHWERCVIEGMARHALRSRSDEA